MLRSLDRRPRLSDHINIRTGPRSPRIVIDPEGLILWKLIEHILLVQSELVTWTKRDESLPEVEAEAKVWVAHHILVANTRAGKAWCVTVKWVPFLNGRHLKPFEESCSDGDGQRKHHVEKLVLTSVQVAIDVEEEDYVDQSDVLSIEFYRAARPQENEDKKFEGIGVGKVGIVDVRRKGRWEEKLRPKIIARGLHEVEDE